jgi:putative redox protein
MDGLLSSLAGCTSVDVVEVLAKRRTPVSSLTVDVDGTRVESNPKRFKQIALHFKIAGDNIERAQAERAIDLSLTKYCSVRASLREDIQIEWTLELS